MFDKSKFAQILKNISETYDNQRDFSKKSEINRTYLSQYMNMKLDQPPKPKILEKLANASHGIVTYEQLMNICGYMNTIYSDSVFSQKLNSLEEKSKKIEKEYLNSLLSSEKKLNLEEHKIFNDLRDIIPFYKFTNYSSEELDNELKTYFDNMDFINSKSKKRIFEAIKLFANYLSYSSKIQDEIFELKDQYNNRLRTTPKQKLIYLPIYGVISAGQPNWVEDCIEGQLPIDPDLMGLVSPEEYFFLRVNEESMNNIIRNGAFALIHKQDMVEDGEIAVVLVNGYDATLKRFTKKGDVVVLEPDSSDPSFKTQIYDKTTSIKILGKYVGKMEINK